MKPPCDHSDGVDTQANLCDWWDRSILVQLAVKVAEDAGSDLKGPRGHRRFDIRAVGCVIARRDEICQCGRFFLSEYALVSKEVQQSTKGKPIGL